MPKRQDERGKRARTVEAVGESPGTVAIYDSIEPLAGEWDALVTEVGATPFLRPGWVERAWRLRAGGAGQLLIFVLRQEGRLRAVLPVHLGRSRRRLGLSTASCWFSEWVGEGIVARDDGAARAAFRALFALRPASVALVSVNFSPPISEAVEDVAAGSGYRLIVKRLPRGPVVDFSRQGFEEYRAGLARKFSKELGRVERLLQACGPVSLEVTRAWDEALFEEGLRLEAAGWKGKAGSAILSRPRSARFYREVARWAAARGILVLAALRVGTQRIAFELGLLDGGVYYALKAGYDPRYARFSPGNLLTLRMLEWVSRHGRAYEFLGNAEPYKLRFSPHARSYLKIDGFRSTPFATVVGLALSAARKAKGVRGAP
jgi:CelD/BcsL family acetyltransferase involved in cellulose biosynthesis